ncbi:MAG: hypothetical protein ACLQUY_28790 [Ktedonobacterales bacterium]
MQTFILGLHVAMVPLILAVAGLTLVCGITLWIMTRGDGAQPAQSAQPAEPRAMSTGRADIILRRIFRIMLIITAALGVLQAVFGALLYTQGERPADGLHFVYGLLVLGAIPVAYVYSDQKQERRDTIIMCIAVLVVIGAAVRALMTG